LKKKTIGKNIHYRVVNISHLLSAMLAKKHPKIAYGIRVEVDAYIHWG
jgi:hypothetical protein